ncbi:suppressor of fused domain protein [Actinoallomurus acaciae]|uniref:Suppressor of fused domain protein n=1 Tax=Actinoallomurus acaciae TaxID=502577 RepID=A0ABV5YIH0_9ACTN
MSAPPVLRDVFHALRNTWGEEDHGHLFENGPGPLSRLDVLIYRPTGASPMTSFATIGMAVEPMPATPGPGGGGRVELQFARRGGLDQGDEYTIAEQLANIAAYPWITGSQLNWGHTVALGRDFPTFPGCGSVFLSGPLSPEGWDYIPAGDDAVRILNVVPITEAERARARLLPPVEFAQELIAQTDVYTGRADR